MQTFFDFTPPKHLTAGVASVCGPRVKTQRIRLPQHALSSYEKSKAELSWRKYGRGVCSLGEREKKKHISS